MAIERQRRRAKRQKGGQAATRIQVSPRFSDFLRTQRRALKLSLREVYQASGVSDGYISQLENAKRPPPHPDILKRLAPVYRVPLETLLAEAGYLEAEAAKASIEEEVDRAFEFVRKDPSYRFGTRLPGELTLEIKRFIVEMYEKATGKRLLRRP